MQDAQLKPSHPAGSYTEEELRPTAFTTRKDTLPTETTSRNMKRISEVFFLSTIGVSFGMLQVLGIAGFLMMSSNPQRALLLFGLASLPLLFGLGMMMVLFYKMWSAIQDGHARMIPGKAVGFLFIPLFNVFWSFQVIWGFAKDYNAYTRRHCLTLPDLPEGLFLTYTILAFTGWIPVVGLLLNIADYFIALLMISRICTAVNALPE